MRVLTMAILSMVILGCQYTRPDPKDDVKSECSSYIWIGQTIDDATAIMAPLGDGSPLLAMETGNPDLAMKMWPTNSGIVVVVYSRSKSAITSIGFHLSDERPKGIRKTFDFKVSGYEPSTGNMTIIVPNKLIQTDGSATGDL